MSIFHAVILGLIQGFAEFLPISSSAHLALAQEFLGISQDMIFFDVFVHFATLLAVVIYFRKELLSLQKKELLPIAVASIPVGVIGFLFEKHVVAVFGSVVLIGVFLVISGILNCCTEYFFNVSKSPKQAVKIPDALVIGLFQAVAILPGISRSGATLSASAWRGIERTQAFRFSFFIVIPVILGANALHLLPLLQGEPLAIPLAPLLVGGILAFVSGLFNLKVLEYLIKKARMSFFGWYCIVLGCGVIGYSSIILN